MERTYVDRPGPGLLVTLVILALLIAAGMNALIVFSESAEWTESLNKPGFALSGLQIGLMWQFLFACLAATYWFIRRTPPLPDRRAASIGFAALLIAILAFPFYAILPKNLLNAFVGTLGSAFIAWFVTVLVFRNSRKAGVALLPIPLWLSFASVIAYHVYKLNPERGLLG